jgi:hypothetical protein
MAMRLIRQHILMEKFPNTLYDYKHNCSLIFSAVFMNDLFLIDKFSDRMNIGLL